MGYVHSPVSFFTPPNAMIGVTGTYTVGAGAVAGTFALKRAAAASTGVVSIPLNFLAAAGEKGTRLLNVEIDYELLLAVATSVTAALKKITRGVEGAVGVVSTVTTTQDLAAAVAAATQDQHRLVVTLTTPEYVSPNTYYFLELTLVCGATVTVDILGAYANCTVRL